MFRTFTVAVLVACAAALPVAAATYKFAVTSVEGPEWDYVFLLPDAPIPNGYDDDSFLIGPFPTSGPAVYAPPGYYDDFYTFYTGNLGGGFNGGNGAYDGEALFTGTTDAPVFKLGTFALGYYGYNEFAGSLTISAVPEPASWALMITGFALAGAALRRRVALA